MENIPGFVTQYFRNAFKVLSLTYKRRFWVGVLLGIILDGLRSAAVFMVGEKEQLGLALNAIGTLPTVAVGITLALAPLLFRKRVIDEEYTQVLNLVDEILDRGKLSEHHRQIVYNSLLQKIQADFSPSRKVPRAKALINTGRETAQEVVNRSKDK